MLLTNIRLAQNIQQKPSKIPIVIVEYIHVQWGGCI